MVRYPTLPSRPSYWTFTLVHYIRRDAPPYLTTSAYPGLFHLVGFSCAWAAPIITFWFQRIRGVQKHPPPLRYRLIHCGPPKCGLPPAQAHQAFPGKPTTSSLTAPRADRPAQGFSPNNLATTTTSTAVDYNLNFHPRLI